jgi:hypothetical protein
MAAQQKCSRCGKVLGEEDAEYLEKYLKEFPGAAEGFADNGIRLPVHGECLSEAEKNSIDAYVLAPLRERHNALKAERDRLREQLDNE